MLKKYFNFINEAFDLNASYLKFNIPILIQKEAEKSIGEWLKTIKRDEATGNFKMPSDVNIEKLKLWYARCLINYLIENETKNLNSLYNSEKETTERLTKQSREDGYDNQDIYKNIMDTDRSLLNQSKNLFNYLKGKPYEPKNLNETRLNSMILNFKRETDRYLTHIKDYIFSSVRNINIWKINYMSNIKELYNISVEWHDNLKASGSVTSEDGKKLIEYPDGFYWIDLETNDCEEEANAMGHCGRTGADTILSLRHKKQYGNIEPFVTVAIDYKSGDEKEKNKKEIYDKIYQCKGKNNKKPIEKYHKYIVDLYITYNIGANLGSEYEESQDFEISDVKDEKLLLRILNEKPDLIDEDKVIFYEGPIIANYLIEKHPQLVLNLSSKLMSNNYYLYEKELITKEDLVSKYTKSLAIKDDEVYLKFNGEIVDLHFLFSSNDGVNNRANSDDIVKSLEDGLSDFYFDNSFKDLYFGNLTDKAIRIIKNKIEELKNGMDEGEIEELEKYDDWKKQVKDIDKLEDLKRAIELAYNDAENDAAHTEKWEEVCEPILNHFGMENFIWQDEHMLIKINKNWLIRYDKLSGVYHNYSKNIVADILSYSVGNEEDEDGNLEMLKIDVPYYGWTGSIDKEILKEMIEDRVSEVKPSSPPIKKGQLTLFEMKYIKRFGMQ